MKRIPGLAAVTVVVAIVAGCGSTINPLPTEDASLPEDIPEDLTGTVDAVLDRARPTDGPAGDGKGCTSDAACDDNVYCNGTERCVAGRCTRGVDPCDDHHTCTADACDESARMCTHRPNHAMCGDRNACNGTEVCDPTVPGAVPATGCTPVRPDNQIDCDDRNNCTIDACDPGLGCTHAPRDLDGDGHVDRACTTDGTPTGMPGNDCNDSDPRVYPGAPEICDDGRDNNCNSLVDYADTRFCTPRNDSCAAAQVIRTMGAGTYTVTGSTVGLGSNFTLSCGGPTARPTSVFTFTLPTPQDIALNTDDMGAGTPGAVVLASSCMPLTELRCGRGTTTFPLAGPSFAIRSVPAGTYHVLVQTSTPRIFRLRLTLGRPTTPPEFDTCPAMGTRPTIDLGDGMARTVSFGGLLPDYSLSCDTGAPSPDAVYPLTLTGPRNVTVNVTGVMAGDRVSVAIFRAPCGVATSELRCAANPSFGVPMLRVIQRGLAAGTYYVIIRNGAARDLTVQATLTDPSMRVTGDACPGADVTPDGPPLTLTPTRFDSYADHGTICGSNAAGQRPDTWTDWVVHFRLTTPRDVTVNAAATVGASTFRMQLLSGTCGASGTAVGPCLSGTSLVRRYRGLTAGDYYLVMESTAPPASMQITVTTTAPGVRLPGDTCPGVDVVPDGAPGMISSVAGFDTTSDYGTTCGSTRPMDNWTDWVYHFRLTTPRDVTLTLVGGTFSTRMQLQSTCGAGAAPIGGCVSGGGASLMRRYRSLAAGDYYVVAEVNGAPPPGPVLLIVSTTAPGMRLPGDACPGVDVVPDGAPGVIPTAAGFDNTPDVGTTCGSRMTSGTWTDWVFHFRLTAPRDVTLNMLGAGASTRMQVYNGCGGAAAAVGACLSGGSSVVGRFRGLAAGDYYVVGESTSPPAGPIQLIVSSTAPGVRVTGDVCMGAPAVTPDGPPVVLAVGAFDNMPDHGTTCGSGAGGGAMWTDWVASYTLTSERDVVVTMNPSPTAQIFGMIESVCGMASSVIGSCATSPSTPFGGGTGPITFRLSRQRPGTYFVVGETRSSVATVTVSVATMPPGSRPTYARSTPPASVTFIDACRAPGHTNHMPVRDDGAELVSLPFAFRYWGVPLAAGSRINISTNGWIGLDGITSAAYPGVPIPNAAMPNSVIAAHWDDDYTRDEGICVATVGTAPNRQWVVEWADTHYCCGSMPGVHLTYEIVLSETTNTIDLIYQTMDGARSSPNNVTGIENQDGTDGVAICGGATLCAMTAGTRIRLTPMP